MSVIFFLIAIGILVAGGFLVAFIWSVRSGQYDDDYTPSVRMLFDPHEPDEITSDQIEPSNKNQIKEQSEQSTNHKS